MAAARKSAALAAAAARTVLQQEPAHFGFMACKASAASALSAQPNRALHASASAGNNAIIVGSFAVAAGAIGMRYAMQAYEQWSTDPARKHNAMKWHYKGDFEDEMSTSEAAKILGIRESASVDAVRKAHRKLMILNHPDAGGSTYLAGKVNEAKDKLMGKSGQKAKMD
ncbi:TIM14-1 [Symbiodinium sp. KB8]|nr:TIM14-1 [Symbiodinium sp. KB8]